MQTATAALALDRHVRRTVLNLQFLTVAWMLIESSAGLYAARQANSSVLLAFGSDSLVELLSACVVLLQFVPRATLSARRAARSAAILLFLLCGVILCTSLLALFRGVVAESSALGIGLTASSLVLMPWLASMKRGYARVLNNSALAADAVQSATCAYLAGVTLCSLALNAWLHIGWIDSVAALLAIPIVFTEAARAWKGQVCACC